YESASQTACRSPDVGRSPLRPLAVGCGLIGNQVDALSFPLAAAQNVAPVNGFRAQSSFAPTNSARRASVACTVSIALSAAPSSASIAAPCIERNSIHSTELRLVRNW